MFRTCVVVGWVLTLGGLAHADALPLRTEVTLDRGMRVEVILEDEVPTLRVRGASTTQSTLPGLGVEARARVVDVGGARVLLVELGSAEAPSAAALVVSRRGRPEVLWTGKLTLAGDLGERRRDVIEVRDRTGDGVDDIVVGFVQEGRDLCGREALLDPRAVDPRTLQLRSVTLPRALEGDVVELAPQDRPARAPEAPEPVAPALRARATSSTSGTPEGVTPTAPIGLTDSDLGRGWIEGRAGDGQGEFATLAVDGGLEIRALRIAPRPTGGAAPRALWLVGDDGPVLKVTFPVEAAEGAQYWVVPPEPLRWSCLAVVLGDSYGDRSAHAGIGEITAFTSLDFGGGIDALVGRLAGGGGEAAAAARLLGRLGAPAAHAIARAYGDMPETERRAAIAALAAIDDPISTELLVRAATEPALHEAAMAPLLTREAYDAVAPLVADGEVGDETAIALSRVAPTRAAVAILAAMSAGATERPELRRALRTAIARGDEAVQGAIVAWRSTAPIGARAAGELALAEGTETRPLVVLDGLDAAEAFDQRYRFALAAGVAPASDDVDAWLEGQLASEEWMMREVVLSALAQRLPAVEMQPLAEAGLRDEYPRVRMRAITIAVRDPAALEAVATLARRDPWAMVRAEGIEALTESPRARPILRAALGDRAEGVRAAAITALQAAGDAESWPQVAAFLTATNEWPVVIRAAIAFARQRCQPDVVAPLGAAVERGLRPNAWAPDIELAVVALEALAAIGGPEAEAILARAGSEVAPPPLRAAVDHATQVHSCRQ